MKASSNILTAAYIELIRNPEYSVLARLNLIYYIFDWLKSRFYFEKDEKIRKKIQEIEDGLVILRESYETELESSDYAAAKRSAFEKKLDAIRFEITNMIENFEVLDASMVSEFYMGRKR